MPELKPRKMKVPKRVLALPDLEHAKAARAEQSDIGQRPADVRPRDSRVRGVALLGAAARVQSHRCAPIPHSPGTTLRTVPLPNWVKNHVVLPPVSVSTTRALSRSSCAPDRGERVRQMDGTNDEPRNCGG